MAHIDAKRIGAAVSDGKGGAIFKERAYTPITSTPAAIKAVVAKPLKPHVTIDGVSLTSAEYDRYRAIKVLGKAKTGVEPNVYIVENKTYTTDDGRISRRIEFIVY